MGIVKLLLSGQNVSGKLVNGRMCLNGWMMANKLKRTLFNKMAAALPRGELNYGTAVKDQKMKRKEMKKEKFVQEESKAAIFPC